MRKGVREERTAVRSRRGGCEQRRAACASLSAGESLPAVPPGCPRSRQPVHGHSADPGAGAPSSGLDTWVQRHLRVQGRVGALTQAQVAAGGALEAAHPTALALGGSARE